MTQQQQRQQQLKLFLKFKIMLAYVSYGIQRSKIIKYLHSPRMIFFWIPLDYYLWGAVKDKCYAGKPETFDALKDNICEAIDEI